VKTIAFVLLMTLGSLHLAAASDAASANAWEEAALAAQAKAAASAPHTPSATTECAFPFSTGTGNTFLKYCVTANGNIVQLETPQGVEHVAVGTIGEGYGVCDFNTNTGYFDYAGFGDSGWGPAKLVKQTATSVKIARTTTDGIFTLTQTITEVPGTLPWIKISMALKNNSAVARDAFLIRYVDVDADGVAKNNFDTTEDSAFAWNSLGSFAGFGLVVQNVGQGAVVINTLTQFQAAGPDPCNPVFNLHLLTNTDGSLGLEYLVELGKGASTTVNTIYRGM